MTPSKAIELTSKSLHSTLIKELLVSLELSKDLPEEQRAKEIASYAFLIAKEVYGQAREELNRIALENNTDQPS